MIDSPDYPSGELDGSEDSISSIDIDEILPATLTSGGLFLGSFGTAFYPKTLSAKGVSRIVAVLDLLENWHPIRDAEEADVRDEFDVLHLDISDQDDQAETLEANLSQLCDYIDTSLTSNKGVFVHCHFVTVQNKKG